MKKLFLYPGQLLVVADPCEVSTVLGSCVALVLIDDRAGILGVNHYLLPYSSPEEKSTLRHAEIANAQLLSEVLQAGAQRSNLKAGLFGGARMFANLDLGIEIGQENIKAGHSFIRTEGLKLVASDLEGDTGRRLYVRNRPSGIVVKANIPGKVPA